MYSRYVSGVVLRRYSSNFTCEAMRNAHFFPQHCTKAHDRFKWCGHKMSMWLREQSIQIVKTCTRQFEFIAAQRVRRTIQIFNLYTRLWDEMALTEFIKSWRSRVIRNGKDFFIGAVGVTMFNWEQERISDKEMYSYSQELEGIHKLREATVICSECNLRLIIDANQPGIVYCQCQKVKYACNKAQEEGVEWQPFIERQDMLVWKREEKDFRGLYSYKVYGSFDDVSAQDFLQVQIDIDYRKEWDATVKQLEIIDTDPSSKESIQSCNPSSKEPIGNSTPSSKESIGSCIPSSKESIGSRTPSSRESVQSCSPSKKFIQSCSDVIYWEMVWPRMFANRDYVYQRRWLYDKDAGIIIIVSKGTDHPNAPNRPDTYRVTTYWSYMVIKPYTNFNEPGIEFVLTYFDDPGVNIPSAVTAWVAMSGLPDYLCRMRQAGKDYKNYKALQEETQSAIPETIIMINDQDNSNDSPNSNVQQNSEINNENFIICNNIGNEIKKEDVISSESSKPIQKEADKSQIEPEKENEEENSKSDSVQDDDQGLLDYFFLAKLFA